MRLNYLITLTLCTLLHFSSFGQIRQVYLDTDGDNAVQKISFYSPSEGYVAFKKWIGYTTDSGRTMGRIYITNTNVDYNGNSVDLTFGFGISGVTAFDRNTLIAYGDYGFAPAILSSGDGGTTWKLVFLAPLDPVNFSAGVTDLVFPQNANIGYAIYVNGILKTTDKGKTWSVQMIAAGSYFDHIQAADDNNVIAMSTGAGSFGTNKALKTINGGASWDKLPMPIEGPIKLDYVYFLNSTTGWLSLLDQNQKVYFYKTTTAGGIWQQINDNDATPFSCTKMHFVDENTGYALAGFDVYKTLNGGVTWEPLPRPAVVPDQGANNDIQCLSPTQLWAGGDHGFLELSTNGGGTPLATAWFKVDTTGVFATGRVSLLNYSRPGYQYQWLVNNVPVSTSFNSIYIHNIASAIDSIQLIVSNNGYNDTLKKYQRFFVPVLPAMTSFSPQGGGTGTEITIRGSGFTNVTAVRFATVPATSFTIVSDTVIQAVVGAGASGNITLTDIHGDWTRSGFTFYPASSAPVPVITSIFPFAAPAGGTVTISGSQFDPSAIVSFGSVRAAVQSATPTSIICTVPAGASYGQVSVLNPASGLSASSSRVFNVDFPDSSNFTPNSFLNAWSYKYDQGYSTRGILGKDIDGDGKPDLVSLSQGYNLSYILVFRNTSSGGKISFDQPVRINGLPDGVNLNLVYFDINDIDGDGKVDLLFSATAGFFSILKNTSTIGNISFTALTKSTSNIFTAGGVIADLDNDGLNDCAFAGSDTYHTGIAVTRNTGIKGTLALGATQLIQGGSGFPIDVAAGDLNGDGKTDLVMLAQGGTFSVFLNNSTPGNISFTHVRDIPLQGQVQSSHTIKIAYFQGLGLPDIIVGNNDYFAIYSNYSQGNIVQLKDPVLLPVPFSGQGASLGNYSGGSRPDLLTGIFVADYQVAIRNTSHAGAIRYDSAFRLPGNNVYYTAPADFDGDGKTDIIDGYNNDGQLVVLKNSIGYPVDFTICNSQPVPYQLASDITGKTYRWQQDKGTGFADITDNDSLSGSSGSTLTFKNTPVAWSGYKYRCTVEGLYSSIFRLQMNIPPHHDISYTVSDSTTCYRGQVLFTATPLPGNASDYSYKWQINGVDVSNPAYGMSYRFSSNELNDKDQVRAILWYDDVCGYPRSDTGRAIVMAVTYPSINISSSTAQACAGQPVTFTAAVSNVGTDPGYRWSVNGSFTGDNASVYTTSTLQGTSSVQLYVDASAFCGQPLSASSNILSIVVGDTTRPLVKIAASGSGGVGGVSESSGAVTICAGTPVTFTATVSNAGSAPFYQWLVNGSAAVTGTNAVTWTSSDLNDKDIVQCQVTGSSTCVVADIAVSDGLVMTVRPTVTPSVQVSASQNIICSGASVVFTALPQNEGDRPVYHWSRNSIAVGDNSPTWSGSGWSSGETVSVVLISSASCAIPDTVSSSTLPINVVSLAVTVSGDSVLARGTSLTLSAKLSGGDGVLYQWEDSTAQHSWQNISGANAPALNYSPTADGDAVRCKVTGASGCDATSRPVKFRFTGTTTLHFYPNPATSILYLDNPDASDPIDALTIATMNGNKIRTLSGLAGEARIALNLGGLNPGVYFIQILRSSGKTVSFEFQKQ